MLLYRTQPMGYVDGKFKSVITNLSRKQEIMEVCKRHISCSNRKLVDMITDASLVDAMLLTGDYKNILVVTSSNPTHSDGDHLLPVIHKYNNAVGKITVTTPKLKENIYGGLYEELGIDIVESDAFYMLGEKKVRLKHDGEPFDAVVLLGTESLTNGKHNLKDIKSVFAPYCVEGFDLIDVYRGSDRNLLNVTVPLEGCEIMCNVVTNNKTNRSKDVGHYERLFYNIDNIKKNKIYKVG
mgnify:FL=1